MKAGGKRDDNGQLSEINIIPLVDIMLVLLIIFMVTAPMMKEGIDINIPEVSGDSIASAQDDFILSVDSDGKIYLNDEQKQSFSIVSIEDKLKEVFKDKKQKKIYLKADQTIRYGYVVEVMAACKRAGVEQVGMMTVSDDEDVNPKISKK